MSASNLKRIKELEADNSKLKRKYADMALETGDERSGRKKALRPTDKCEAVAYLIAEHRLSIRRSCCCLRLSRAAYYQTPKGHDRDAEVIDAINTVIDKPPR